MTNRPASEIRTLFLASLGGALEFYDFVIFVFFTAVLAKLFFPPTLPEWVRQLDTFGIFAAGYLARPLGGIVMAHFGDLRGRKRMFTFSILLMAIPTLLIGLLPTYHSIGLAAPILLLVMRVTQGIAMGGEAPGGWVFVAEHARPGRTGLAVGLLTSGLSLGILLGSLVATIVNMVFTPAQIGTSIWRLPFLIGGAFGFIAMFLRRWLQETPVFEEIRRRAAISRELPLRVVFRNHGRSIAASILSTWMLSAAIVVVILMTPALLQQLFKLPAREVAVGESRGLGGAVRLNPRGRRRLRPLRTSPRHPACHRAAHRGYLCPLPRRRALPVRVNSALRDRRFGSRRSCADADPYGPRVSASGSFQRRFLFLQRCSGWNRRSDAADRVMAGALEPAQPGALCRRRGGVRINCDKIS